jgi:hypothetical protein
MMNLLFVLALAAATPNTLQSSRMHSKLHQDVRARKEGEFVALKEQTEIDELHSLEIHDHDDISSLRNKMEKLEVLIRNTNKELTQTMQLTAEQTSKQLAELGSYTSQLYQEVAELRKYTGQRKSPMLPAAIAKRTLDGGPKDPAADIAAVIAALLEEDSPFY